MTSNFNLKTNFWPLAALIACLCMAPNVMIAQGIDEDAPPSKEDFWIPRWDVAGGVHYGIFDCNQTNKYPVNFGAALMVNYFPNKENPWFGGVQLGSFYVSGEEDFQKYGREIKMLMGDLFLYAGYELPMSVGMNEWRLRGAIGLPIVEHISINSAGLGYVEPETGIGFGLMGALDLPNRLSIFTSAYRINKDMDGFGHTDAGAIIEGNEKQVTYVFKLGVAWNFIPRL